MKVQFETHQVVLPANSRDVLIARVTRSMSRMSEHVKRLDIQLKETNDTKSPKVKVCTIQAHLVGGGVVVVVVDKSSNAAKALFRGTRRCRTLVSSNIRRRRNFRTTLQPEFLV